MFLSCFGVCLLLVFFLTIPRLCAVNIDARNVLIDVIKEEEKSEPLFISTRSNISQEY